ncbi:N5-glutamine methyltransferase family protein [Nitrospirillum sp. BR 11828]|uniref:N5-glutamine methyltransferase family protein n=1 Tax=Nitrospirillum sp. BR 11828 TaxID=3104325 RepID=UPI003A100A54
MSAAIPPPAPLRTVLKAAEEKLAAAGCASPRLDVRLLAEEALGWSRTTLLLEGDRPVPAEAQAALAALVDRRAAREPVSRILGKREFWSLEFRLAPDTLDPRPDTETLVETALRHLPDGQRPRRLLDLGTGSGCILLALLSELPGAWGLGVDIAPGAARAAAANARDLGFANRSAFLVGSWTDALADGASGGAASTPSCPTRPTSRRLISPAWSRKCGPSTPGAPWMAAPTVWTRTATWPRSPADCWCPAGCWRWSMAPARGRTWRPCSPPRAWRSWSGSTTWPGMTAWSPPVPRPAPPPPPKGRKNTDGPDRLRRERRGASPKKMLD